MKYLHDSLESIRKAQRKLDSRLEKTEMLFKKFCDLDFTIVWVDGIVDLLLTEPGYSISKRGACLVYPLNAEDAIELIKKNKKITLEDFLNG